MYSFLKCEHFLSSKNTFYSHFNDVIISNCVNNCHSILTRLAWKYNRGKYCSSYIGCQFCDQGAQFSPNGSLRMFYREDGIPKTINIHPDTLYGVTVEGVVDNLTY
jgi:hypothetical protein